MLTNIDLGLRGRNG